MYNIAGPGQKISDDTMKISKIFLTCKLKIGISLSCTKCPETVQAAQSSCRKQKYKCRSY